MQFSYFSQGQYSTICIFFKGLFGVLESQAFIGRKRVRTIYLNASEITELGPRTLNGLVELEILHLENNLLHSIGTSQFSNLTNLREMYLQFNKLTFISSEAFINLNSLQVTIPKGVFAKNEREYSLTLNLIRW
ncbi:toll-like receptor Tollo [Eurytemora carolleeae]|uniref:toll-like receptor Tollo n=1 Tax=Eurytemora carolleeae TaxID=1294199 RepID=UPI000C78D047|nr:toll-like receptor Tollo [Eurytemora carolleeae]|eukprot:XP_023345105.1 toll-like receptor Tollo [Eurytemora affinis]